MLEAHELVGTWRLQRWSVQRADGSCAWPLGPRATGVAIYGADGWMGALLAAGDRPPLSATDPRAAPEAERAAAFNACFAYACAWRLVGSTIEHEVREAQNPSMIGSVQRREARLDGDTLVIATGSAAAGGRHELVWRRAGPAGG